MAFVIPSYGQRLHQNSDLTLHWNAIVQHYKTPESQSVNIALDIVLRLNVDHKSVQSMAKGFVDHIRENSGKITSVEGVMQIHKLGSPEGLSLTCLAEALLRIKDNHTQERFIKDKLEKGDWSNVESDGLPQFLANWGLNFSERIMKSPLKHITNPLIRPSFVRAVKFMGSQFVMAETIDDALKKGTENIEKGHTYSFDLLGEAAKTDADALVYFKNYADAIEKMGENPKSDPDDIHGTSSISIKLTALHPRFEFFQYDHVMGVLYDRVLQLCEMAHAKNIALTIDAEEVEHLEPSLEIVEKILSEDTLKHWNGLGLAVQAYQKRALPVIDFLVQLARHYNKRIAIRLVKGAYWDTEIKKAQEQGLEDFPVFTHKAHTDINYFACAITLLENHRYLFPQFATQNAHTMAFIIECAKHLNVTDFEFQRLHGMGEKLHNHVVKSCPTMRSRIYAPVGIYKDLLSYLVRRLLENGANSSFVNMVYDKHISVDDLTKSPLDALNTTQKQSHPKIQMPLELFHDRANAKGFDVTDTSALEPFSKDLATCSIEAPEKMDVDSIRVAMVRAEEAQKSWGNLGVEHRAKCIERYADLLEDNTIALCQVLADEAGKTIMDGIAEVREAVDFCRYYANQARKLQENPITLPGPTGEDNILYHTPRGVFVAIAPWNFPLAIFVGQIVAGIVTGNAVVAKCACQTPRIAAFAHRLALYAKIPEHVFQLVYAPGPVVGESALKSKSLAGVVFTGSTKTAQTIQKQLITDHEALLPFIAETGGLNAMIVDSSALPEQVVNDVVISSFQSAGQRCSALRLLVVQDDVADDILTMLKGAVDALNVGDPHDIQTDIGPVIDKVAFDALKDYESEIAKTAKHVYTKDIIEEQDGKYFIAPQIWELNHITDLKREIFGPILHVVRYKAGHLKHVLESINASGFGLTFGVHSRLDSTIEFVKHNIHVGNVYINRSIIGAVVGVQPFGGQGLSGTGFKAGGPNYLLKFVHERTITENTTAAGGNTTLLTEI